ncbi:uncharacterized protein LOC135378195 [Ornithodoros turicata]|uniref:uncharacterized protein LOC135378195 n=1 Tax=Ornithodoros turicata TaxID=34597 RepID=UPI003139F7F7
MSGCSSRSGVNDNFTNSSSSLYREPPRATIGNCNLEEMCQPRELKKSLPREEYQRQTLRLLHMMRLTLMQHGELLQDLCSHRIDIHEARPALVQEPFVCSQALEEFSNSLNNSKTAQLVDELSHLGGNDVGQATRNMLCYLLTDSVASEYSWLGQKGKKKFPTLKLPGIIYKAVRGNAKTSGATKVDVECAIKSWLRHARDRRSKQSTDS